MTSDTSVRRRAVPSPQLEEAEQRWWSEYGDVEDEYCWVQTPQIQQQLRGHYLRHIVRGIPRGSRVLEVGCGAGWLCLLLARYGASRVDGLDFSAGQVERARAAAAATGCGDTVRFFRGTLSPDGLPGEASFGPYDALVIHAVLHHLSEGEIHALLETFRERLAAPDARVFIVEPVQYRTVTARRTRLDAVIDRLIHLPRAGARRGWRRVSPAEAALTERIDSRGDSPKEAPFEPGELEALLSPHLRIERRRPVLNFSYLGAKNALLMRLSHPRRARFLLGAYLGLLSVVERVVLKLPAGATWLPLFVLYECRMD